MTIEEVLANDPVLAEMMRPTMDATREIFDRIVAEIKADAEVIPQVWWDER